MADATPSKITTVEFEPAKEMNSYAGFATRDGERVDPKATAAVVAPTAGEETGEASAEEGDEVVEGAGNEAAAAVEPAPKTAAAARVPPGVQKKINQAVGRQRQAERQLDMERAARTADQAQFERRLKALEERPLTGDKGAVNADPDKEPDPSKYEYGELDRAYIKDVARYEARQEFKSANASQTTQRQTAAQAAEQAAFVTKRDALYDAGLAKHDDFDEVVIQNVSGWPCSPTVGRLMISSPVGDEVAYYLGTNPKVAREIFGKSELEQAAAFGRIESKFTASSAAPKKAPAEEGAETGITTQVPPAPLQGARGGRSGKPPVSGSTTDFREFESAAMSGQK